MNICEDRHTPKYLVIYKPFLHDQHDLQWLVCETYLAIRNIFGDKSDNESMEILA